jgi:hypothetical protein
MNEKSHVSMERHLCLVCGTEYDTGTILLDRRLRASLKRYTTTGWGLCPEDQRLFDDGFVALVECDPGKSGIPSSADRLKPTQAYRTGRVLHLKRDAFGRVFNVPIEPSLPSVFVEPGVIEKLEAMREQ